MSPLLFSVYFDRVASYLATRQASEGFALFQFAAINFAILLFADDVVLVARDAAELQRLMNTFNIFCSENSLRVNSAKTKAMLINCTGVLQCNDVMLENVSSFVYLGLLIDSGATSPFSMLHQRLQKSKQAFCKLQSKARLLGIHNCHVRVQLVQSLAVSQLLFGCAVWGCLAPAHVTLSNARLGTSAQKKLWLECEVHLRHMLRWAVACKRDIRTSLIYIASNCPSV